jgi:hypothetical protein
VNIPPIPITSTTARTIIKGVAIKGTPKPTDVPSPSATPTETQVSGCPESAGFGKQETKKLYLGLDNPTPGNDVVIENISLTWTGGGGNLKSVAFLSLSWNGSDGPPSFDLSTYSPTPVWSGNFDQQDMIFTFAGNISGTYFVTVTFGGGCPSISEQYID